MRLCDEYQKRIGMPPLLLRHSSKLFLFFDQGKLLLSVKWLDSGGSSSGKYEFRECVLGKAVQILDKVDVEWSCYEEHMTRWLSSRKGFVFDELEVSSLVWDFFVKRNDRPLSKKYDPFVVFSSLGQACSSSPIMQDILNSTETFWDRRPFEITKKYAYHLKDWR